MTAELIVDSRSHLGEGPIWHPDLQQLFWVDIEGKRINRYDPITQHTESHQFDRMPGALVPINDHQLLIALEDGLAVYDWPSKTLEYKNRLGQEQPMIRANDGKCDPNGKFWIGTMHLKQIPRASALYCLDGRYQLTKRVTDRTISNGLAWSGDQQTMYYIDSPEFRVMAFDFDPATSQITNQRIVIEVGEAMGAPDGMTIDQQDKLWIAHWGGHCVRQWDPLAGVVLSKIEVAAPHVTSCTFGGPQLDELFITSARAGLSDQQLVAFPHSGGVFKAKPNVKGRSLVFFQPE